jgi:formylglycine-generating enzyme required for sulfatase activity
MIGHTNSLLSVALTVGFWVLGMAVRPPDNLMAACVRLQSSVAHCDLAADGAPPESPHAELAPAKAVRRGVLAEAAATPKPGELLRDCASCAELVVVPAGEFDMGSGQTPYEKPQHHVTIANPFAVGRHEVTFAEWDACVAAGGCNYRPDDQGWGRGNRPVIDVSWDDAKVFARWQTQKTGQAYRLPSESEWEYVARAGTTSLYWWGREAGVGRANCEDCGGPSTGQTLPAGSFRPNAFGLYDTAGNAAEWVEDCWNDSYRGAPQDGSAWLTGQCRLRVLRGGSFANKANVVRSAARFRYDEDVRYYANGFRLVRDLK